MAQIKRTKEEISERAKKIYEKDIKIKLSLEQRGQYLSIDVESGDYELGTSSLHTALKLKQRHPEANIFTMKHGSFTTGSIGFAPPRPDSWSLVE